MPNNICLRNITAVISYERKFFLKTNTISQTRSRMKLTLRRRCGRRLWHVLSRFQTYRVFSGMGNRTILSWTWYFGHHLHKLGQLKTKLLNSNVLYMLQQTVDRFNQSRQPWKFKRCYRKQGNESKLNELYENENFSRQLHCLVQVLVGNNKSYKSLNVWQKLRILLEIQFVLFSNAVSHPLHSWNQKTLNLTCVYW